MELTRISFLLLLLHFFLLAQLSFEDGHVRHHLTPPKLLLFVFLLLSSSQHHHQYISCYLSMAAIASLSFAAGPLGRTSDYSSPSPPPSPPPPPRLSTSLSLFRPPPPRLRSSPSLLVRCAASAAGTLFPSSSPHHYLFHYKIHAKCQKISFFFSYPL